MDISTQSSQPRRILRLPEVELRTGFKRAHIYNLISQGRFPKSISLGARAVGWDSVAVEKWIEERISQGPSWSSSVERGEALCSGLMKPDTLLGENTRQIEVSVPGALTDSG